MAKTSRVLLDELYAPMLMLRAWLDGVWVCEIPRLRLQNPVSNSILSSISWFSKSLSPEMTAKMIARLFEM